MMPIGPLMIEHRLIERVMPLIEAELGRMAEVKRLDIAFVATIADFFRTYAEALHFGKEEGILFPTLGKKDLFPDHRRIMDELISEHAIARREVAQMIEGKDSYAQGNAAALDDVSVAMRGIVGLYPAHQQKEDKTFFFPAMGYLSKDEQDRMLQEFWEFDRRVLHDKYKKIVEDLRNWPGPGLAV
ncbi:MAG: hemerythrin domain-containing protein [Chloroflexi bacterium]|nr:hemerythrin domain-containing protein [Chloroflexota bacterium]